MPKRVLSLPSDDTVRTYIVTLESAFNMLIYCVIRSMHMFARRFLQLQ